MQKIVGAKIRRLREDIGLTQEELARAAGCSNEFISLLELGKRDPSLSTLTDISRFLKKDISYFLSKKENPFDVLLKKREYTVLRSILKEFQIYCRRYTELEEMSERSLQTAPLYTHLSAERMADQERRRMAPGRFLNGRLFDMLELHGLRICRQVYPKESKAAGVFVFLERRQAAFVSINAHLSVERQNMVAVHAYAHYLRDRLDGPIVDNLDIFIPEYLTLYPGREAYAQTFARHFLLPGHHVLDILDNDLRVKNPEMADIHYLRRLFSAPGDEVLQALFETGRISKSSLQRMRRHFPHMLRNGREGAIPKDIDNAAEELLRPSIRYRSLCVSACRRKKIEREQLKEWLYGENPAPEIEENPVSDPEEGN